MLCPNCDVEMKLIPAGVSKSTHKPYKAFYSCPECKETMNAELNVVETAKPKPAQKEHNGSEAMMRLAYRKDLMVAIVNKSDPTTTDTTIKDLFTSLWEQIEQ